MTKQATPPNKNSAGVVLEIKYDKAEPVNKFIFAFELMDVVRWINRTATTSSRSTKYLTLKTPQLFELRSGKEVWIGNIRFKLLTRPFSEFDGLESFKHS